MTVSTITELLLAHVGLLNRHCESSRSKATVHLFLYSVHDLLGSGPPKKSFVAADRPPTKFFTNAFDPLHECIFGTSIGNSTFALPRPPIYLFNAAVTTFECLGEPQCVFVGRRTA